MPTEMPTLFRVSGERGAQHSGSRRGRFREENPTGTGHCANEIRVFIPLNTHRHTAVFEGVGFCS